MVACSSTDIEATVEAKLAQERAVDATVEARVKESVVERVNNPPPNPALSLEYQKRAHGYNQAGDYQSAIADYNKAIELGPSTTSHRGHPERNNLGMAYVMRGYAYHSQTPRQNQLAIDDYTMSIQVQPGYAWAYHAGASAYRNLGEYTLADADKAMACSLDSQWC